MRIDLAEARPGSAGADLVEKLACGEIQCGSHQEIKETKEVEEIREVSISRGHRLARRLVSR